MPGKWIVGGLAVAAAGIGYYHYEVHQVEQKLEEMAEALQPLGRLHYTDVRIGLKGNLHVDGLLFEPRNSAIGRMRADRITLEAGNLWQLARLRQTLDARRLPRQLGFSVQGLTPPAGLATGRQGDMPALWLDTAGCGHYEGAPPDQLMASLGYRDIPLDFSMRYHLEDRHDRLTIHSTLGMGPLGQGVSSGHFELQTASNRARDVAPALMTASLQSLTVDYEDRGYYPALMELCAAEMDMTREDYIEHHQAAWLESWRAFGLQPGPGMVEAYEHFIQEPSGYSLRIGPIDNPALLWTTLDHPGQWLRRVESSLAVGGRNFGRLELRAVAPRAPRSPSTPAGPRALAPAPGTPAPSASPSPAPAIAVDALDDHVGRSLRITLADGRARHGELLTVEDRHIRVRRRIGSGYIDAPIAIGDIADIRAMR